MTVIAARSKPDTAFDVEAVRAEFPILNRTVNGKPLVYLDSAASAQKPAAVLDAMRDQAETAYANVHRGLHTLSNEATAAYEAARGRVAQFLNAESAENVVLTAGATDAINLVAQSWAAANLQAGDEIILSVMEHHANIVPWHFLRERLGVVLKWVPVTEEGDFDMAAYEGLLSDRTKLVALTHMSNVLGCVTPAAEIARKAHAAGAKVLFDGCQSAVHGPVDVRAIGADFYAISPHKIYGPTGIGALYVKPGLYDVMRPHRGGGEMIAKVTTEGVEYADPPHMFEAGTPAILEARGLTAALDWFESYDMEAVQAHEARLLARASDGVRGLNWVKLHGTAPSKEGVLAFTVDGAHPHDIAQIMDRYGVAVRAGHHCAQPLHTALGITASVRASFGLYNTEEEVDLFLDALVKARNFFA